MVTDPKLNSPANQGNGINTANPGQLVCQLLRLRRLLCGHIGLLDRLVCLLQSRNRFSVWYQLGLQKAACLFECFQISCGLHVTCVIEAAKRRFYTSRFQSKVTGFGPSLRNKLTSRAIVKENRGIVCIDKCCRRRRRRRVKLVSHGTHIAPHPVFGPLSIIGEPTKISRSPPPSTSTSTVEGQIDPERIRYLARDGIPEVPSPLHYDSKIYFVKNGGILTCIDFRTGERLSRMRTGGRGTHYASPIIQGDLLFSSAGGGTISVIRLADKPKVIATNQLESPVIAASAIVEGIRYIRTRDKLCTFKVAGQ